MCLYPVEILLVKHSKIATFPGVTELSEGGGGGGKVNSKLFAKDLFHCSQKKTNFRQ